MKILSRKYKESIKKLDINIKIWREKREKIKDSFIYFSSQINLMENIRKKYKEIIKCIEYLNSVKIKKLILKKLEIFLRDWDKDVLPTPSSIFNVEEIMDYIYWPCYEIIDFKIFANNVFDNFNTRAIIYLAYKIKKLYNLPEFFVAEDNRLVFDNQDLNKRWFKNLKHPEGKKYKIYFKGKEIKPDFNQTFRYDNDYNFDMDSNEDDFSIIIS